MLQIADIFDSEAVALYITQEYENRSPFLGEILFPNKKIFGTGISWYNHEKVAGELLKPSNYDAVPTLRTRGQASLTKEEMILFRESIDVKEADIRQIANVRDENDPLLTTIVDSLYSDTKRLADSAENVAEVLRMQLLAPANGEMKITIGLSDNTMYAYNYDKNGAWKNSNYLALSGTDIWDNPTTSKPLSDMNNATSRLRKKGIIATDAIMNSATFLKMSKSDEIKAALITFSGQPVTFITDSIVKSVVKDATGLNIIIDDDQYTDYSGQSQKFYPDNYVSIIGNQLLGNTYRGSTPEETTKYLNIPDAPVDISVMENGIAIAIQTVYKPSFAVTTTASQIVLPSYEGMDGVYVMKVA